MYVEGAGVGVGVGVAVAVAVAMLLATFARIGLVDVMMKTLQGAADDVGESVREGVRKGTIRRASRGGVARRGAPGLSTRFSWSSARSALLASPAKSTRP